MLKNIAILAAVAAVLLFIIVGVARFQAGIGDVEMSSQGNTAMVLGIVLTVVVGCGITGFFFLAARRQSREEEEEERSHEHRERR